MSKTIAISFILLILLAACGPKEATITADQVRTAQAETQAADAAAAAASLQTQAAVVAAIPTLTLAPPTITVARDVYGTASANVNCRSGPDGAFALLGIFLKDTTAKVIGKNDLGSLWLQIELDSEITCWVSGDLISLSSSLASVPDVVGPPVPTGFYSAWVGTWTAWQNLCGGGTSSDCNNTFPYTMVMTDARTVVGNYSTAGCSYTDIMVLSADGMRLDGQEFDSCGGSWEVHLVMDPNLNQFRGRWSVVGATSLDGYFCGARNGYSRPVPERP